MASSRAQNREEPGHEKPSGEEPSGGKPGGGEPGRMPRSADSAGSRRSGEPESQPESQPGSQSESRPAETTECANCGRPLGKGTVSYCPRCGQEVGRELGLGDVAGAFLRELIDVERGFGPTLQALTLRPGKALREYLGGAYRKLMNPGRYLLAAIVIEFIIDRVFLRAGLLESEWKQVPSVTETLETSWGQVPALLAPGSSMASMEGPLQDLISEVAASFSLVLGSQSGRAAGLLLAAGLLALLLRQVFRAELSSKAEALALASFLVGHATAVKAAVKLASVPPSVAVVGGPVAGAPYQLGSVASAAFLMVATYGCFEASWRNAVLGALSYGVAFLELVGLALGGGAGYVLWAVLTRPAVYLGPEASLLQGTVGGLAATVLLCAAPLLLQLGIEARYWRSG